MHAVGEHQPQVGQAFGHGFVRVRLDLVIDSSHVHRLVDDLVVVGIILPAWLVHEYSDELDSIAATVPARTIKVILRKETKIVL